MLPDDVLSDVEVWPDNALPVALFLELATQWRHGMNGITGLDYTAVVATLDEHGLEGDTRRDAFSGIKVMERAVLKAKMEKRDG